MPAGSAGQAGGGGAMIRVVPDFYPAFHCIASGCRHSCCVGWEVDVDQDALDRYRQVPGPLGRRLADSIDCQDTPHFRLDSRERCPFLNGDNLCDIILELGEEALCQICTDHPRFRNWFPDRMEEGLGLCCEEAARLLLSHRAPIRFLPQPWPGEVQEPGEEYCLLFQRRETLLALLQDRSKPLQTRLCEAFFLHNMELPRYTLSRTLALLEGLEVLEPGWQSALDRLKFQPRRDWDPDLERDGEHLMVYLVYRYYLSWGLERWDETFPLRFGAFSLELLAQLRGMTRGEQGCLTLEHRVEWLRQWSAELEYSEDNLDILADRL